MAMVEAWLFSCFCNLLRDFIFAALLKDMPGVTKSATSGFVSTFRPKVLSGQYDSVLAARLCATFAQSVVPATTGLKHDAPLHIHYPRRFYWGHRLTAYQQNVCIPPTLLL
ncbi:hypothetical protein EV421DRAFT_1908537 [Armillaria borealis]|uniref:Secreted protein n=1 Tax=Armillaria borealis TaxID=47425 RepID=A0AA39MI32_9AGAR|nr:hypothetical protein EV421DRAFT_1908537 [Armillaria borealis]